MVNTSSYESKKKLLESLMIDPYDTVHKKHTLESLGVLGTLYTVLDEDMDEEKHHQAIRKLRTEGDSAAIDSIDAFIFCLSGAWVPTGVAPRHASTNTVKQLLAELIAIGDKTRFNQIVTKMAENDFLANLGRAMAVDDPVMIDLLITFLQENMTRTRVFKPLKPSGKQSANEQYNLLSKPLMTKDTRCTGIMIPRLVNQRLKL